jgi:hypothetical protein
MEIKGRHLMTRKLVSILLALCLMMTSAGAQDGVTVPDLTGLSVPAAAAALNRLGLSLGAETNQGWTAESGLPQNTIAGQSIPAGGAVAAGTAIDVTVLRSANTVLIYDDNDLTVVNRTGGELNLAGLTFTTLDGNPAQLAGARWSGGLRQDQCVQVWSVGRNGPKGLDECSAIQNWLVTNNPAEHFWTGGGGTTQFAVLQNGVQRAACPIANPGRCEFYLAAGAADDATPFVYFAYTPDRLAIINTSSDQWMVLAGFTVVNYFAMAEGAGVPVGDPTLYPRSSSEIGTVQRLAPGQCILYTDSAIVVDSPPQPCDVIARLDIGSSVIFWGADFGLRGSDGQERSCPVATPERLTICVMPR